MKIEMHAHTCEVSPCAELTAKETVNLHKQLGYDGMVITNHFDQPILDTFGQKKEQQFECFMKGYRLAKEEGDRIGLTVILGMELRFEGKNEDFLLYGVTDDFIYRHMDLCKKTLEETYQICQEEDVLLIQAHPFRHPCKIQNPEFLHGIERNFNANHENHNECLDEWLKKQKGRTFIITKGSDCHEVHTAAKCDFYLSQEVFDSVELAEALRKEYKWCVK